MSWFFPICRVYNGYTIFWNFLHTVPQRIWFLFSSSADPSKCILITNACVWKSNFNMIRFILLNYLVQYQVSRGKFVGPCSWNKRHYWLLCQGHFPFVFSKTRQQRQHYCSHYTHAFFWMHEYQGIDHWNMYQSQNLKQDCWQCVTKNYIILEENKLELN